MPSGRGRSDDDRDAGARLEEIMALIRSYGTEVTATFGRRFSASEVLRDPEPLIARFEDGLTRNGRTISNGITGRLQPERLDGLAGIRSVSGRSVGV